MFRSFDLEEEKNQVTASSHEIQVLTTFSDAGFDILEFEGRTPDAYPLKDGLRCFLLQNKKVSSFLCLTDPKVRAGTFSIENLKYFHEFLNFIETDIKRTPFIFIISSGGVRLTQSRTMFNSIWGVLPRLFRLKKQRPFFTLAHKICLGAGALFFGQGHYRIASHRDTLINLTGPGVISSFFGEEKNFSMYASAGHQFERHLLVQEIAPNLILGQQRIVQLLNMCFQRDFIDHSSQISTTDVFAESAPFYVARNDRNKEFFTAVADGHTEILPNYSSSGKSYIARLENRNFGLLINPLDHPINALSVGTIERYQEALKIFRSLRLPLLVVTDTPGGDPRQQNSDSNVIMKTLELIESFCDYPESKVGLIAGRCFGGSGLFALPIVHGSQGLFALKNSKIGAISDEFIEKLAAANPIHYAEWKISQASHKADLSDLLNSGNLSGIIDWAEVRKFVADFLDGKLKTS
jgi:acetyl-CoA carboxylase carboxyltransferase component